MNPIITAEALKASNAEFTLPPVPHIEDRITEMRELAKTAKVEHAMVVGWHSGEVLWRNAGDSGSVDIAPANEAGLTHGNLIIHTHPGPAELSIDDAACVNSCAAMGNMAVCADGTVSWCGPLRIRNPWFYQLMLPDLAKQARLLRHISGEKCNAEDPIEIARDNRTIVDAAREAGWITHWQTHYSDALIAAMPTTAEGE